MYRLILIFAMLSSSLFAADELVVLKENPGKMFINSCLDFKIKFYDGDDMRLRGENLDTELSDMTIRLNDTIETHHPLLHLRASDRTPTLLIPRSWRSSLNILLPRHPMRNEPVYNIHYDFLSIDRDFNSMQNSFLIEVYKLCTEISRRRRHIPQTITNNNHYYYDITCCAIGLIIGAFGAALFGASL